MTDGEIRHHLLTYGAGLEAEMSLLRQLRQLATTQQQATDAHDFELLHRIADQRDRLMAGLVQIEHEIAPIRHALAGLRPRAARVPGYDEVVALHRQAGALVTEIMSSDDATMKALREAELARRAAAQAVEAGESTLAAYRRVIAPYVSSPSLVDERG